MHAGTGLPSHVPAMHSSLSVQGSPSSQAIPSAAFVVPQPVAGVQSSTVQGLPSSVQVTAAPPEQVPLVHVSPVVHASESSHDAPSAAGIAPQPLAGSHISTVHGLPSSAQVVAPPPPHAPAPQTVAVVHGLPSSQPVPSATFVKPHVPVAGSQSGAVHGFASSGQSIALPPPHAPAVHVVLEVHALPSSQLVPFATGVEPQPVAESQLSAVQGLPSPGQKTVEPPPHAPAVHVLPSVHWSPSSQAVPLPPTGSLTQPSAASQRSTVHGLPSSAHVVPIMGSHEPAMQTVDDVHAFASSHEVPSITFAKPQPVAASQSGTVQGLPSSGQVIATFEQPVSGVQSSVVQALPSSQLSGVPSTHAPLPSQVSSPSQRFVSAHEVPTVAGMQAKRWHDAHTPPVHARVAWQSGRTAKSLP
jgi:hypothetical protein